MTDDKILTAMFTEYAMGSMFWNIKKWHEFEKKFVLHGYIKFDETKEIERTIQGYKFFFDNILLNADKVNELYNLTKEEISFTARYNIHLFVKKDSKRKQFFEFLFTFIIGVISQLYLNWEWLFIIIGIYSFLKISWLFILLKKEDSINKRHNFILH